MRLVRRFDNNEFERLTPLAAELLSSAELRDESAPAGVIDALLEAMFLMAVADGEVHEAEVRQFARTCERLLGEVTEADVEGMFLHWAGEMAEEGWEPRMRNIAGAVAGTELGKLAFRLAVAMAIADERITYEEAEGIELMAQALGIDPDLSHAIFEEVKAEIFSSKR